MRLAVLGVNGSAAIKFVAVRLTETENALNGRESGEGRIGWGMVRPRPSPVDDDVSRPRPLLTIALGAKLFLGLQLVNAAEWVETAVDNRFYAVDRADPDAFRARLNFGGNVATVFLNATQSGMLGDLFDVREATIVDWSHDIQGDQKLKDGLLYLLLMNIFLGFRGN